ncbi:F-box/WD repeat-containing protein 9-like [Physella acuta]|uniref:F-box/WD repeat-containing protein 9-like n=1 Tax=Physella acuta TaxID=109671 RepID=UPI0027DAB70B|nr:F-box/WD repeat-containing protein 9-like [Physella acuta]XP_059149369.1 F-box/WD repeat-containing protein 9-like [Physella acuta]
MMSDVPDKQESSHHHTGETETAKHLLCNSDVHSESADAPAECTSCDSPLSAPHANDTAATIESTSAGDFSTFFCKTNLKENIADDGHCEINYLAGERNRLESLEDNHELDTACHEELETDGVIVYQINKSFTSDGLPSMTDADTNTDGVSDLKLDFNKHYNSFTFEGPLTLDQLDDDVLFYIATFLEARVIKHALSKVCLRFQDMFASQRYWKMRISKRWPKKYPAVSCPPDFKWDEACIEREDIHRVWTDTQTYTDHFMYSCNVYGEVDAVHLMKDGGLLVSGDRNRSLNLIDLTKYPGPAATDDQMKDMLVHSNTVSHEGWIWSITSVGNDVITGSWDTSIRMFDAGADCKLVSSFKCKSPVLSLYAEENEIVASCFDKKVYFIDRRTSNVRSRTFHTKPVLCVTGNDNFILSGSEDKSISIYDRRAGKIFMMFKLDSYPLCMSYSGNQLWFGDKSGHLHLHDGTEGVFQYAGFYNVSHTEKITGVINTPGAIFTCSGDRTVKVLEPTKEPDVIATLSVHNKEIAKIDYRNGVLVSAGGDECIGVWVPKHWGKDAYRLS